MPQVFPHQEPVEPAEFGTSDAASNQRQYRQRLRVEFAAAIGKIVFLVSATVALLSHHYALLAVLIGLASACAIAPRALATRRVQDRKRLAAGGSCQVIRLVRTVSESGLQQ